MMKMSNRNTTPMITVVWKFRFRLKSLLMNVATAMTTAGGTEIQAAMCRDEAGDSDQHVALGAFEHGFQITFFGALPSIFRRVPASAISYCGLSFGPT